jgi:flavorubredoxin
MKVGIIVHSQSGHTAIFGKSIAEYLRQNGIEAEVGLLRVSGTLRPGSKDITIRSLPEIKEYDTILLGGPVWGMNVSPVIPAYLNSLDSLKGRKTLPFVTYALPWKALGANQALKKMKRYLEILHADVLEGEALHYFFKSDAVKMQAAAKRILERIRT